jgi:hypothetical protein
MMRAILLAFSVLLFASPSVAQNWGTLEGEVRDAADRSPLSGVTIVVDGTNYGTATWADGTFNLRLPAGAYAIRFSSVGYVAILDSVQIRRDTISRLRVLLEPTTFELEGIEVTQTSEPREAGVFALTPEEIASIPAPFKGYQSLMVLPGVATASELSNQYSVRGGGYNENLIFINGFEVFMPFRVRQGEQEGLGLFNPEMARGVRLYTGGFPARYGGKLASALEIAYGPTTARRFAASAYGSSLDGGATASWTNSDRRAGFVVGVRRARAQRFFGTQERKGDYSPEYSDAQFSGFVDLAPGQRLEAVGILADHVFAVAPTNQKTYFGIVSADPNRPSDFQALWLDYSGSERDRQIVGFAGLRSLNRVERLSLDHAVSYYRTDEEERFNIAGTGVLFQVDPGSGDPGTGEGHFPVGTARQEDFAYNDVSVETLSAEGRYTLPVLGGAFEAGWWLRRLEFADAIDEKAVVIGPNREGDVVRIVVDSLRDSATLTARQSALYAQHTLSPRRFEDRLVATIGLRADHFDFTDEWTLSPRISARYEASEILSLTASWGVYRQPPTYRELRGRPEPGKGILGSLNTDLQSQTSYQTIVGAEYFMRSRRLFVRGEVYHKLLRDLVSYDIENIRVRYSGDNDSDGYAYGMDLQLRGELVPGLESWVNYSLLVARERFRPEFSTRFTDGLIPRPTDQRHTISAFIQDHVPGDESWTIHMRALFGSGLPYTPPLEGPTSGGIVLQVPGNRSSARFTEYMRMDLGVTKSLEIGRIAGSRPVRLQFTGEILNLFDMVNTVAYTWVPGGDGVWRRIPRRLTPRTINVRARIDL